MYPEEADRFCLLGHDGSAGFGTASQVEISKGYAFVAGAGAYDGGTEGFTVHDVRDPGKIRKVAEFRSPAGIHSHKLRIVHGDLLYLLGERLRSEEGSKARAGLFIFDISTPSQPKQVGFFDMPGGGPHRFSVDNERSLAFLPNEAEGWNHRVVWTLNTSDPIRPQVVSIWGLPEQNTAKVGPPPEGEAPDSVFSVHGPPVTRGNRMFFGMLRGGAAIVDCTDFGNMQLVSRVSWSPPFPGITHTVCPIGDMPYMVVTDEGSRRRKYWDSQFMWIIDIREQQNPVPITTWFPERKKYFEREGRFGAHNILETIPAEGPWANTVFITYYNAGLRAVDVSDPLRPVERGFYVPAVPGGQKNIQSTDIGTDENGLLYLTDRWGAGMHVLEYQG